MRNDTTYDLLKPLIESISKTFSIKSAVDNMDGTFTLSTCNTLWVIINEKLVIDSVAYKVVDMEPNEWIKIKGASIPVVTEFNVNPVHFFNNTVLAQDKLLAAIPNDAEKFPLVWLHEITPNKNFPSPLSAIDRIAECELYFLSSRNITDWERPEDEKYVIKPMRNLMQAFIDVLLDTPIIFTEELKYTSYDHANFGHYEDKKGYPVNIFNDQTSGTQFSGQLQFFKVSECAC